MDDRYGESLGSACGGVWQAASKANALCSCGCGHLWVPWNGFSVHMHSNYQRRKYRWAATSTAEKKKAIADRHHWLGERIRTTTHSDNPYADSVDECRFCGTEPEVHALPSVFWCRCGAVYVIDRWLPDEIERLHRF